MPVPVIGGLARPASDVPDAGPNGTTGAAKRLIEGLARRLAIGRVQSHGKSGGTPNDIAVARACSGLTRTGSRAGRPSVARRRTIRRGRSRSSCRSAPAGRPTSSPASSASICPRRSSSRSWSRTGRAPARSSAPTRSRSRAPDGYTLLVMSNTHTVNESLIPNKPFQLMRDFVPVRRHQLFRPA